MDNNPEFIALATADWAEEHSIDLEFIQPVRLCRMALLTDFVIVSEEGVLGMYVYQTLSEACEIIEIWK